MSIMLGYGSSSPASASLFIYNPTTSSMVTSYIAPSPGSTLAITSLPAPTQTGSQPKSNGGTGTTPGGSESSGTPSNSSGSSGSSNHTTAIALGTTFGVLGLVAGGLATIYYMRRVRNRNRSTARRFFPLADIPEFSSLSGSVDGAAPEAAHLKGQTNERVGGVVSTDILAYLGISKSRSRPGQPRKDMFADEDTRSFGHSSTVQRQDSEGMSVWSLRSVSALVRSMIGREPSGSGVNQGDHEWEKNNHIREGVQEGLIHQGSLHSDYSSHPTHRRDGSFWSYTDPFEDPIPDDEYDDLDLRPGIPEKDADYDHSVLRSDETDDFELTAPCPQDSVWPFSVRSRMLAPLREASYTSFSDPSNSLPSLQEPSHGQIIHGHADNPALPLPTSISPTPRSPTTSHSSDPHPVTSPRYSTISGSDLSHSQSICRRDSWWSRLTKPPLLDRRTSITSSKPLDFRDPRPAPPLATLEEAKKSTPTRSNESNDTPVDIPAEHGRSLSSAHSGRTANTDSAEHLGGNYDVVQRLASDGSSSRRALSLGSAEITEQEMLALDNPAPSEIPLSSGLSHVDPPRITQSPADPTMSMDVETPSEPLMSPKSNPISLMRGAIVTSRVRAYERRLSQELESQQTPTSRNTRHREEVPSRTRPTIQYGVVPRASLFIANPDHLS